MQVGFESLKKAGFLLIIFQVNAKNSGKFYPLSFFVKFRVDQFWSCFFYKTYNIKLAILHIFGKNFGEKEKILNQKFKQNIF